MNSEDAPHAPDEAFALLGDATRMAILRALWEAPDPPVSFSELRDRVGRPDSGRFNYHLDRLRGHFLAPEDGGYRLTQAGREVVRAVTAGTLTERPARDPAPIDADCPSCGGALTIGYDEHVVVECADCGAVVMWNEFPPAGLAGRSPTELARAFDRWTRRRFRLAADGVCPNCAAEVSTTVVGDGADLATEHRCPSCRYQARVPVVGHLADHPAVVSLFAEADIDVADLPYWALEDATSLEVAVLEAAPLEVSVTLSAGDRGLELTLGEGLAVEAVEPADLA